MKYKISNYPILALESTILAHGMPYPENYAFAKKAVFDGRIRVVLKQKKLKRMCQSQNVLKLSKIDLPFTPLKKQSIATTVSTSIWIIYSALLFVFSTDGTGGGHLKIENHLDISIENPNCYNVIWGKVYFRFT